LDPACGKSSGAFNEIQTGGENQLYPAKPAYISQYNKEATTAFPLRKVATSMVKSIKEEIQLRDRLELDIAEEHQADSAADIATGNKNDGANANKINDLIDTDSEADEDEDTDSDEDFKPQ
jgi:hypothetical protein